MYPDNKSGGRPLKMVVHDLDYVRKTRIGLYDDSILCASCDNQLGVLDEYGKNILLDTTPRLVYNTEEGRIFTLENVDGARLLEFFLSVLWRCSISNLNELSRVNLGPKFEKKIEKIVLGDLSELFDFSTVVRRYDFVNEGYKKMSYLPIPQKIGGINYYNLSFPNGYKVLIKVDSRSQPMELIPFTLKSGAPVCVVTTEKFEETVEYSITQKKANAIRRTF